LEFFNEFPSQTFEKVISSDLQRAIETRDLCFAFEKVNKEENQNLRELFYGKNEGLFYDGKAPFTQDSARRKRPN
jgi:broad specificity phosphatase PhoE